MSGLLKSRIIKRLLAVTILVEKKDLKLLLRGHAGLDSSNLSVPPYKFCNKSKIIIRLSLHTPPPHTCSHSKENVAD